nr:hypothetical protein [Tanacetum cinerariifolium]
MLVWGEADSETLPKRSLRRKLFKTCCMNWGEVNPVHAYYNGSRTSKDNEDPSWSTSFKTRRTSKTSSALEDFICVVFVPDRSIEIVPHKSSEDYKNTRNYIPMISHEFDFAQILDIPCEGACAFTDRWSLDELAYGVPSDGPYQINPPSPDDIISSIRVDQEGQVRRIRHKEEVDVQEYQVLTHKIDPTLNPLEEIIWENVFCLWGSQEHVPACLCYMFYCVVHSKKFNLAYYMKKKMEWVTKQSRLILPYGMLLTHLFKFIINENPKLYKESYVLYDHVMTPFAAQLERKPRMDHETRRGRHSTSPSTFNQPSSSHLNDDDGINEGTSRASTPSPIRYVNSLTNKVLQVFQNPPNIDPHLEPFYIRQTKIINRQV